MTAAAIDPVPYADLVGPDRVHSRLYTDPRVFADEMERIFSGWVYVAHASEVPHAGDYVLKSVGTQPVIVSRVADGEIHVLFNRCTHLANLLCHDRRGNSSSFRCPYHGWTFRNDGSLTGVPFRGGYGPDFDPAAHGLARPAHVDQYRRFVFASVAEDVPTLAEFLGPARETIDRLCELSPEGEVELTGGWLHHRTDTNWKIAFENEIDAYHGNFVHRSLTMLGNWSLVAEADVTNEKALSLTRYLGNGHTDMDWRPQFRKVGRKYLWLGSTAEEKLSGYADALAARHGRDHADELLVDGPPHTMIFPNLFIAELFVLVIDPIAPDRTVQHQGPIRWKGADQLNRRAFQLTGGSIGPAGMVIADDSAMYERNLRGMAARQPEWLLRTRGRHREQTLPDGVQESQATDDTSHRAFWQDYVRTMTRPAPGR